VWSGIEQLLGGLDPADRDRILADTARTFYQLPESETTG
jgi:hypothetical protein